MTPRPSRDRSATAARWLALIGAVAISAGCGSTTNQGTPPASPMTSAIPSASPEGSLPPSLTPTDAPTAAPDGTPIPTPILNTGYQYGDILKVRVNRLAARKEPKRTAAQVHGYNLSGPAPIDDGLVRLNTGDFVSVHLGPLKIGNTVWYLVYPSDTGAFHEAAVDWYAGPPGVTPAGPGWVAASVGSDVYMTLHRRPDIGELEGFLPLGLTVAGTGPFESAPAARHDGHAFDWAAAAPAGGTSCTFKVTLVPDDVDFAPFVAIDTSTSGVKVSPVAGSFVSPAWLPIPPGSWTTFTVKVDGTCRWAIRITPLHHD